MPESSPTFKQISDNIAFDVESLMEYINANLAGREAEIQFMDENTCVVTDFLRTDYLKINIQFEKHYDGHSVLFSLYCLSSEYNDFDLMIMLQENDRLYNKIPPKLIHACKKCLETEETVIVIL